MRAKKPRRKSSSSWIPREEGLPPSQETLANIQDILLTILRIQTCVQCGGLGRMVADKNPDGSPVVIVCVCRKLALDFLEEFGG